ncbi:MAG: lantibiotic dehydratase, partial [Bacteroidota bacterium]
MPFGQMDISSFKNSLSYSEMRQIRGGENISSGDGGACSASPSNCPEKSCSCNTSGSSVPSTLTDDLLVKTKSDTTQQMKNSIQSFIYDKAIQSTTPVDLSEMDIRGRKQIDSLPLTTSIIAELYSSGKSFTSCIFSIGHSSAINFLARFTGNPEVLSLARDISDFESTSLRTAIVADVAHIPKNHRTVNVLGRNKIWEYSIGYHAQSVLGRSVIELSEIEISVEHDGEVAMWRTGTNSRIFPKISSAISTDNTSPIFKFLADVENDGKGISFGLDIDERHEFMP